MDSEAEIIIAFLFNRSGKNQLKESDLYLPLSMELGWLSTKEAQAFVKTALSQGLLEKKGGLVQPTFPLDSISIPVGFTPSKQLFPKEISQKHPENLLDILISEIGKKTHQDQKEILDEITKEAHEKNLLPVVAALYVARRYNGDVSPWFDSVESLLLTENK
jgi:hypothetical protein